MSVYICVLLASQLAVLCFSLARSHSPSVPFTTKTNTPVNERLSAHGLFAYKHHCLCLQNIVNYTGSYREALKKKKKTAMFYFLVVRVPKEKLSAPSRSRCLVATSFSELPRNPTVRVRLPITVQIFMSVVWRLEYYFSVSAQSNMSVFIGFKTSKFQFE